jgi:hypothetical protein
LRVAPHSFAWIRVPRATYYLLRIYRGPRLIFSAEPTANRIVLPGSWRFAGRTQRLAGGRYRWSVRPGFGPPAAKRYGREIVRAALVVQ